MGDPYICLAGGFYEAASAFQPGQQAARTPAVLHTNIYSLRVLSASLFAVPQGVSADSTGCSGP